jgi:hypothetical protein
VPVNRSGKGNEHAEESRKRAGVRERLGAWDRWQKPLSDRIRRGLHVAFRVTRRLVAAGTRVFAADRPAEVLRKRSVGP